nr:hypothetical protein B0A51_14246 [Rachicladosporium sp. CCFEE 5018]
MSKEYEGQDPIAIAQQAERDLNSTASKQGSGLAPDVTKSNSTKASDSSTVDGSKGRWLTELLAIDSGINEAAVNKFPGATVQVGGQGAGNNREIPVEEGGDVLKSGQTTKASDFEGRGGPEDKAWEANEVRGGDDDVAGNVRQGGETRRP